MYHFISIFQFQVLLPSSLLHMSLLIKFIQPQYGFHDYFLPFYLLSLLQVAKQTFNVAHAGLELRVLPHLPICWPYRHAPLCPNPYNFCSVTFLLECPLTV